MAKGAFGRDLEDYLKARHKKKVDFKGFFSKFKPAKKEKKVDLPEDVEVYDSKEEIKEEVVEKKKDSNVLGWISSKFKRHEKEDTEALKFEIVSLTDDLKDVAKVALTAVKKLPDDALAEFKQSPEFENLKKILKQHNLIK